MLCTSYRPTSIYGTSTPSTICCCMSARIHTRIQPCIGYIQMSPRSDGLSTSRTRCILRIYTGRWSFNIAIHGLGFAEESCRARPWCFYLLSPHEALLFSSLPQSATDSSYTCYICCLPHEKDSHVMRFDDGRAPHNSLHSHSAFQDMTQAMSSSSPNQLLLHTFSTTTMFGPCPLIRSR